MTHPTRKLVTVIAEAILERDLVRDLEAVGLRGYTITEARGRGERGSRGSSWSHSANIRMEVLCESHAAERFIDRVRARYFENYAIILYAHDVEVLRPEKYGRDEG